MTIKGATFDIGGVLYSDDVFKKAIKKALVELNATVDSERFETIYKSHLESHGGSLRSKLCLEFLGSLDRKAELLETTDKYWIFEPSDQYKEVRSELFNLHDSGLRLGIIANQPISVAESLKRDGLFELFDFMGISALVKIEKPKRELFELAISELGLAPNEIVHIGNRIDNDVKPAKNVGMRTIWVMRGEANPNPTESDLSEADLNVSDLKNISEIIKNL